MAKLGRKRGGVDKELEQFRSLLEPPEVFEEGFSWAAFLGALFVALVMVPGAIYMALIAGESVGPAAQWVTVILFIEVARRANKSLKKAEIFTLFYLAGALMAPAAAATGMFGGGLRLLYHQFYAESSAALANGISKDLPIWVVPTPENTGNPDVLEARNIMMLQWLPAIGLIVVNTLLSRLDNMVLGYGLFRLASDIEKLPFPLAPLGAQGILALSEEQEDEAQQKAPDISGDKPQAKRWRWRVFSIGSAMGLIWGAIYVGLPIITGALLEEPIEIFPIPFVDMTQQFSETFFKAVPIAFTWDLIFLVMGMLLPFWAMVGSFLGLVAQFVMNPLLYQSDVLRTWRPNDKYTTTHFKNQVDFYLWFSIGLSLAIASIGLSSLFGVVKKFRREKAQRQQDQAQVGPSPYEPPAGRGDIRPRWIIAVYFGSTLVYIGLSLGLLYQADGYIHAPVILIMLFYGFLYTPMISYATARLEGMAGQVINIPFVREACYILSGYQGVAIWFLPIPLHDYGRRTVQYRQAELTGTKFRSIWKAEIVLTPIIIIAMLLFAHLIWRIGDVPSGQFMFAQEMWPLFAETHSLIYSSTLQGYSEFEEALNKGWPFIPAGFGLGLTIFGALSFAGAPTLLFYGLVRGLGQALPHTIFMNFLGAIIGRFYFQKRLGAQWRQYIPVIAAGFGCGMGLIGTAGVGITFLVKSVFQLPL